MIEWIEWIKAVEKLNELVNMMGYQTYTIVDADKNLVYVGEDKEDTEVLTFADMVESASDYLSWYYDDSTSYGEMKEDDLQTWRSETMKWRNFINKCRKLAKEEAEQKKAEQKKSTRGGARTGAGRKKGDKKQHQIWCSDEEKEYLLQMLEEYRKGNKD